MRTTACERGFTLVEMAAALAVTGLVVAAGWAGLAALSDARSAARAVHDRAVSAANARATLEGWLRSATRLVRADDRSAGAHPLHELEFVTADGGELWPGPRRIRLRVDIDPATPHRGLVATLRDPDGPASRPRTVALAPQATGLEITYRFSRGGRRTWTSRWPSEESRVPSAVRVRLVETARISLGPGASEPDPAERGLAALHGRPLVVPMPTATR
jgi:prepilin-type N-terminal cleavage/methylation domain-containing protein